MTLCAGRTRNAAPALLFFLGQARAAISNEKLDMRCCMMNTEDMGWMTGGGAVIGILIIVLLAVAIAAGVKYLRSGPRPPKT